MGERSTVLDELDQAVVGPVEVFEYEDHGAALGDPLEEGPDGGVQLGAVAGGHRIETEEPGETRLDPAPLLGVGDVFGDGGAEPYPCLFLVLELADPGSLADHLAQGAEGDAVGVGGRAALVPVDALHDAVDVLLELPGESRLADAGVADDRHQPGPLLFAGHGSLQQTKLVLASDERRLYAVGAAPPSPRRLDA